MGRQIVAVELRVELERDGISGFRDRDMVCVEAGADHIARALVAWKIIRGRAAVVGDHLRRIVDDGIGACRRNHREQASRRHRAE